MDVGSGLVAGGEAAELGDPGEGPFHNSAVAAEFGGGLDAAARDARTMDRVRHSRRHRRWSQTLSAWSIPGRLLERTPDTASKVGASAMLSWRFAIVTIKPSGVPFAIGLRPTAPDGSPSVTA